MTDPATLHNLEAAIFTERLARYLSATDGDTERAIGLYSLNLRLSQCLYGVLHAYEITLRNSMHEQLTHYYRQENWYDKAPLDRWHRDQIDKAKNNRGGDTVTVGKIISTPTLAFWTGLAAARYEQQLWVPCLRKAFRNITAIRARTHMALQDIQDLRNRVAHHERILGSRGKLYIGLHHLPPHGERLIRPELILETIGAICIDTAQWVHRNARFEEGTSILDSEPVSGLGI